MKKKPSLKEILTAKEKTVADQRRRSDTFDGIVTGPPIFPSLYQLRKMKNKKKGRAT